MPVMLMGEGMIRLLQIVLSIAHLPQGILLIDEIESGLHYSALPNLWQIVASLATEQDTQVVATTHSYECIATAAEFFQKEQPEALRVYRLDRGDGSTQVATYDTELLMTALEVNFEIR
ncbi:AAA domain-containing protein, putative AbiEii toxin, Type IV TA system [Armatimonadetes bacterium DC]|nr:AAA domain-containing protein, putative AbiEii toxin, Type IV TA system [Armatimonadetes bacterium DC]